MGAPAARLVRHIAGRVTDAKVTSASPGACGRSEGPDVRDAAIDSAEPAGGVQPRERSGGAGLGSCVSCFRPVPETQVLSHMAEYEAGMLTSCRLAQRVFGF